MYMWKIFPSLYIIWYGCVNGFCPIFTAEIVAKMSVYECHNVWFNKICAFFSVTSNLLIHVWLFPTTTNSTDTGAHLLCTKFTFIVFSVTSLCHVTVSRHCVTSLCHVTSRNLNPELAYHLILSTDPIPAHKKIVKIIFNSNKYKQKIWVPQNGVSSVKYCQIAEIFKVLF